MTRVYLFKYPGWLAKFFLVLGGIIFILGFILFIRAVISGFNTAFPSGDWSSVIYIVQGILFILMGTIGLIYRRYYIEWDDR